MPVDTGAILVKQLNKARNSPRPRSKAQGPHAYASEAGGCARQVGLRLLGAPAQPFDDSSVVNVSIGSHLHEVLMDGLMEHLLSYWRSLGLRLGMPGNPRLDDFIQFEVPWSVPGLSGRADGVYVHPDLYDPAADGPVDLSRHGALLEIKSQNSNAFSGALSYGPNRGHVLQGALSAHHLGVGSLHVSYISKLPKRGEPPAADWLLPVDNEAAAAESARLVSVVELTQVDQLVPACEFEGRIISPEANAHKWPCMYCPFTAICLALGPGAQPAPAREELAAMAASSEEVE